MNQTPKSLRLHVGIFGRTNVGKSSLLNMITGQDVAITSPVPGTTTDVVEKPVELLPVGPVLFLDTGGFNDPSALGAERISRTRRALERCDIALLVIEPGVWTEHEDELLKLAGTRTLPVIAVINKCDLDAPTGEFTAFVGTRTAACLTCASTNPRGRDGFIDQFKAALLAHAPESALQLPSLAGDLVPSGGLAVLIVPIDLQAPKGRLILPQVQMIRDLLDNDAAALVVKEREYAAFLTRLTRPPDLVICDSQVVNKMIADTPPGIKCTTFSILFARFKGDLSAAAGGAAAIHKLKPGDRVLIAEACTHHALEDDIGRVKIPRWLDRFAGGALHFDVSTGQDYPADLAEYKLIVHCGACMLNRRAMLHRLQAADALHVPVTNYGLAIATAQGVIERVLSPFPHALEEYKQKRKS